MTQLNFRGYWIANLEKESEFYLLHQEKDPFGGWKWDLSSAPESMAEMELIYGIKILFGQGSEVLARKYFERCLQIVERTLHEEKLTSETCRDGFPMNRGRLFRAKTYADALLIGRHDMDALLQASADFEDWCRIRSGKWDSVPQAIYLAAVRLAMIGSDIERARRLLKTQKSFKFHLEEHALLTTLVAQPHAPSDSHLASGFQAYFDKVRDPRFTPDVFLEKEVLALEFGVIKNKYLSKNVSIDWKIVLDSVSS